MLGISHICLCLFFSQSLISNEMTYFWTDTISEFRRLAYLPDFFVALKIKYLIIQDTLICGPFFCFLTPDS
ncbi:MAG: hypothetical protein C0613_13680 [Desulfobulbaceae bacterium]|nr:MAG: hypothetical protein C0613_13680 [Desulfobulbaceae bacterium]